MGTKIKMIGGSSYDWETEDTLATETTVDAIKKAAEATRDALTDLFTTGKIPIPGIGTGSAYASGDAFGTKFDFVVPTEGVFSTVVFYDLDNEGIVKEIHLFDSDFTATADNSPFDPSDSDLQRSVGVINIATFYANANNQLAIATPALYYKAPQGKLWAQVVTRGVDNIASGSIPLIQFMVS